jgi:hypothetical protein
MKWLRRLMRNRRTKVTSYWWCPSPPYFELPPLASDPSWELRKSKYENAKRMIALQDFRYEKRHMWSPITTIIDVADYQVGYILSLGQFITIFKLKTSKIMQSPKYVTIIKIFGVELEKA